MAFRTSAESPNSENSLVVTQLSGWTEGILTEEGENREAILYRAPFTGPASFQRQAGR